MRITIANIWIGKERLVHGIPVGPEFPRDVIEDVERDDLRVAAHVMRILDDFGFDALAHGGIRRFRQNGEHTPSRSAMPCVVFGNAHDVGEGMARVVGRGAHREKFRRIHDGELGEFFLQALGTAGQDGGFDDGDLAFADERQDALDDGEIETLGRSWRPDGDEDDVAVADLVFILDVRLLERVAHHLESAALEIVTVILANVPLPYKSYERFFRGHRAASITFFSPARKQ